jgi:spermidine synthase
MSSAGHTRLVYLLFFLSGAAGLIYEMSWSRQIGLLFGNTVNAAAVVLAAYFCGMAVGYLHASRVVGKLRHPLLGYGIAELVVALWAVATPLLLNLLRTPQVAELLNSETIWLQTLIRAAVSLLVLLPATAALGATLPFVAQHLSPPQAPQPQKIAAAYGWNIAGAVVGVLGATFVLILYVGVVASSFVAAGLSALCGVVAVIICREGAPSPSAPLDAAQQSGGRQGGPPTPVPPTVIYYFAALSGFGSLALQVLYTRLFALVFHNSTYTFGSIAAVFLIALAVASWLYNLLSPHVAPARIAAWSALLGGVTIPLSVLVMQQLTGLRYYDPPGGFAPYIAGTLAMLGAVIFLPVLCLGLMLPALWQVAGRDSSGRVVGRITAVNTLGATLGSLLASFLILPQLGLWTAFIAFALLYAVSGLLLAARFGKRQLALAAACCALLIPQLIGLQQTNKERLMRADKLGYKFLYNSDSPYGAIDVIEQSGERFLRQNRHYTLGTSRGLKSERLQGALPLLLHDDPQRVCFLGLATGITASAALQDERVESVTSVELIPDVVEAASFFKEENLGIVGDRRSTIVINDARHFLYANPGRYDVIVSDLFVPWHSQTGYLYTLEHYRACRQRLAADGIFCQWLPLYQLSARELEMIADTFAAVFPYTYAYIDKEAAGSMLMLAGSEHLQPPFSAGQAEARGHYLGPWPHRAGAQLNTDEHPRVEFLAPISHRQDVLLKGTRLAEYKRRVLDRL